MIIDIGRMVLDARLFVTGASALECKEAYIEMHNKNNACVKAIIVKDISKWNAKIERAITARDTKLSNLLSRYETKVEKIKTAYIAIKKRANDNIIAIKEYEITFDKHHEEIIETLENEINLSGQIAHAAS